ncbi:hypothetical protein SEEC0006_23230 [Salmonella enterica subsp. enterica serovar Choleraesuis str. 0006]|nr:hypothetical protein SEEC0006_23230 [Salmonella enterica subsp. enterica serovar Choleraesuis str. 0006]
MRIPSHGPSPSSPKESLWPKIGQIPWQAVKPLPFTCIKRNQATPLRPTRIKNAKLSGLSLCIDLPEGKGRDAANRPNKRVARSTSFTKLDDVLMRGNQTRERRLTNGQR